MEGLTKKAFLFNRKKEQLADQQPEPELRRSLFSNVSGLGEDTYHKVHDGLVNIYDEARQSSHLTKRGLRNWDMYEADNDAPFQNFDERDFVGDTGRDYIQRYDNIVGNLRKQASGLDFGLAGLGAGLTTGSVGVLRRDKEENEE